MVKHAYFLLLPAGDNSNYTYLPVSVHGERPPEDLEAVLKHWGRRLQDYDLDQFLVNASVMMYHLKPKSLQGTSDAEGAARRPPPNELAHDLYAHLMQGRRQSVDFFGDVLVTGCSLATSSFSLTKADLRSLSKKLSQLIAERVKQRGYTGKDGPPRPSYSAPILFMHQLIRDRPKDHVTQQQAHDEWTQLPAARQAHFEKLAAEDLERFERQQKLYDEYHPRPPTPPPNAKKIFQQDPLRDRKTKRSWNQLSDQDKQPYLQQAVTANAEYHRKLEELRKTCARIDKSFEDVMQTRVPPKRKRPPVVTPRAKKAKTTAEGPGGTRA